MWCIYTVHVIYAVYCSRAYYGSIVHVCRVCMHIVNMCVSCTYMYVRTYKSSVYMLGCADHGSVLCATIHGFCAQSMDRAYLRVQSINLWTIQGLRCANN